VTPRRPVRGALGKAAAAGLAAAVVCAVALAGCAASPPPPHAAEFLASPDPALRALPFSEAVRAGDFLLLAGQIGNAPGTDEVVPGGIRAEARQVMENIRAILGRQGASMDDVVKCTVFLADIAEWSAFNEVYRGFFPNHFPARSAVGTTGLAKGARVEVECLAYRPRPR
jgi:2-iminobutanoate/2-iminopropanoate deaminase